MPRESTPERTSLCARLPGLAKLPQQWLAEAASIKWLNEGESIARMASNNLGKYSDQTVQTWPLAVLLAVINVAPRFSQKIRFFVFDRESGPALRVLDKTFDKNSTSANLAIKLVTVESMATPTHSLRQYFSPPVLLNTGTIDWPRFLKRTLFTSDCFDCDENIAGKTVLITGAAGSIGSALARRLMNSLAGTLVLLDRSQQNLHALYQEHHERNITIPRVKFFFADILSEGTLQEIFAEYRPQVVFHAAAMKHLPELEHVPFLALENNVLGTLRLLQFIDSFDVEHFINVSTDKAVNPTSVLGVSKRIAELVFLAMEPTAASVASLRLGNVLGSSGSVVPRFIQCFEVRQPLTVTDVHASRYFITMEEAVAFLISTLEAPANSLLLPDMGGPRTILELAAFLHSEFYGDLDAESFRLTGLRDGEKPLEQLIYDYERLANTAVPHLYKISDSRAFDPEEFADKLGLLLEIVVQRKKAGFIEALSSLVPEFTPSKTLLRYVH